MHTANAEGQYRGTNGSTHARDKLAILDAGSQYGKVSTSRPVCTRSTARIRGFRPQTSVKRFDYDGDSDWVVKCGFRIVMPTSSRPPSSDNN